MLNSDFNLSCALTYYTHISYPFLFTLKLLLFERVAWAWPGFWTPLGWEMIVSYLKLRRIWNAGQSAQ